MLEGVKGGGGLGVIVIRGGGGGRRGLVVVVGTGLEGWRTGVSGTERALRVDGVLRGEKSGGVLMMEALSMMAEAGGVVGSSEDGAWRAARRGGTSMEKRVLS